MTSKIVVNNIESDSGINSVTFNSNIQIGTGTTIHSSGIDLGSGNITGGIVTATSFSGSGANLTSIPAAQLSGALPALDGSALTGVGVGTADSINTSGIITATAFVSSQGALSNRNKIINGDFNIHQRGGTIASSGGNYTLDRWRTYRTGDSSGGFSVQQSTGSYPQTNIAGVIDNFRASAFITVTSAGSAAVNNNCKFQQRIEGSHVYDLAFGTAAAKKVTVSFYVKCSLTGDFGVALVNGSHNRSNVQLYTVNSASAWERKVITFDGDTSGSWDFGTGTGLQLMFDMGSGSDKHTSSLNTWVSGEKHGTTSSVKLIHTNGATIQFAGVQLEAGEVATPFEFRNRAEELQRCQRYYYVHAKGDNKVVGVSVGYQTNDLFVMIYPKVEMRATPTLEQATGTNYYRAYNNGGYDMFDSWGSLWNTHERMISINANSSHGVGLGGGGGSPQMIITSQSGASLAFSAEL